jgi:hypothetical protein
MWQEESHAPEQTASAPRHLLDLRGIRRQEIGDDLQVERIADLDQLRPSPDQGLAILDATFVQASTIMSRRRAH